MKFQQLSVGQRFEFEGQVFVKISPLLAQAESSSGQRLLPRSAIVRLLDKGMPSVAESVKKETLDLAEVSAAVGQFHLDCVASVEILADVVPQERLALVLQAIDEAYSTVQRKLRH
ncbi:MAG: hypothetical protein HY272_04885 [Gammaproteobacteria bacterium]|nr:hypothetical protein [Gammaproteobacteria bacterium]